MQTLAIRTVGLTKRYDGVDAVSQLDLEIPPGEVVGYLGPNGAGKTTTIRLLLGLIRPTEVRAEIFGLDASTNPSRPTDGWPMSPAPRCRGRRCTRCSRDSGPPVPGPTPT